MRYEGAIEWQLYKALNQLVRKTTTITPGRQRTRPCGSGCRCQHRSRHLRKWVCFVVFAKCRIINDFGRNEKENMGRYYWNKKDTVEDYRSVSISFPKRYDYFCGYRSGRIVWKNCYDEEKGSIGIAVSTTDSEKYARFYYTVTDRSSGEETDYDYKVNLTTTPCNFGGVRYWFICPLSINSVYCGRRVATLYLTPGAKYFGCRNCYDLSYESRNETRSGRVGVSGSVLKAERQIKELYSQIKRWTYKDKPTKKIRKLQVLKQRMDIYLFMSERFLK